MPFLDPSIPIDRVYSIENINADVRPQHQQMIYLDPEDEYPQRLTIYAGEISVGHGAGDKWEGLVFQYPVLGFFNIPSGGVAVGILPLNDLGADQFRSSIAVAAVPYFNTKAGECSVGINNVAADLFEVELEHFGKINAVVLSGVISSRESHVSLISYKVSVLERMNQSPPFRDPVLLDPAVPGGWTGKYIRDASGAVGPLVRNGIPQS